MTKILAEGRQVGIPSPRRWSLRMSGWDPMIVLAATVSTGLWSLHWPSVTQDEISLVLYADLINHGRVPNADFFTPYGPGTFWPVAGVFRLLGNESIMAARLVGLAYHVLLAGGVWALAKPYGRRLALVAGTMSGLMAANLLLVPYGWVAALSATVLSIVATRQRRWFLGGALSAVACTIRPEFIVVVLATQAIGQRGWRTIIRTTVGFALVGIPLWVHLFMAPELLSNVFVDRLLPNTRLPLSSVALESWAGLVLLIIAVMTLTVHAVGVRGRDEIMLALLSICILPQALQRTDREHLMFVAILVLPLATVVVGRYLERLVSPGGASRVIRHMAVGACLCVVAIGCAVSISAPRGDELMVGERSIITSGSAASQEIDRVVRAVQSEVGPYEVMFIGSDDMSQSAVTPTYLYFLMPGLVPDAYYLELAPGVSEQAGSRLLDDVRSADVLVLSRFTAEQRKALFPNIKPGSDKVDHFVSEHFCATRDVAFVSIYRRCGSA